MKLLFVKNKTISIIIVTLAMLLLACGLLACQEKSSHLSVSYTSGKGGYIAGLSFQTIAYGENADTVTAVPYIGYRFVEWSDGCTDPLRQDKNVTADINVDATFEIDSDLNFSSYSLTYSHTSGGSLGGTPNQTVEHGKDAAPVFANPINNYSFVGWSDGATDALRQDTNITSDLYVTAFFELNKYNLTYSPTTGGSIDGIRNQTVNYHDHATAVTAIPDIGYRFVKWSDGVADTWRQDLYVDKDIDVTAEFEYITNHYTYEYNYATTNCEQENISLSYDELQDVVLLVPEKQYFTFDGWYLDSNYKTQVSNENGDIQIGNELFDNDSLTLYAKWTALEQFTYRILMVYVTNIQTTLTTTDGTDIDINFKMTKTEKQLCELLTIQFTNHLNNILGGLVDFQIDNHFTKEVITKENFKIGYFSLGNDERFLDHALYADKIPEVGALLDNYDSVLTIFNMEDYYPERLHIGSGAASTKYGCVFMDSKLADRNNFHNNVPIEALFDLSHNTWDSLVETSTHELIHTIELDLIVFDYHTALSEAYKQGLTGQIDNELYLLNRMVVDGVQIGIPYEVWKGDVANVVYEPEKNRGYIKFNEDDDFDWGKWSVPGTQRVPYGHRARSVTAVPFGDWFFVGWSDGVTTETRYDLNITEDLHVVALFNRYYDIIYFAVAEGGKIVGESVQSVLGNGYTTTVTAVPDGGYRFVKWHLDGSTNPSRSDYVDPDTFLNPATPRYYYALFEKIE